MALDCLLDLEFNGVRRHYHADTAAGSQIVSGVNYEPRMHVLSIPQDRSDGVVENTLLIDNSDSELTAYFLASNIRGTVTNRFAFTGNLDETILGPYIYESQRVEPDDESGILKLKVTYSRTLHEPATPLSFTPSTFPGLF